MGMARGKDKVELITGLDIGSTSVRLAVGQYVYHTDQPGSLQIIAAIEVPSEGLQKGLITSIEDTVSVISNALEQAERVVGMPLEHVWVGVSGAKIIVQESRGVVAVGRSDGEISDDDVERVVEAARTIASPLNYEVLHVLPRGYSVDGQTHIKDPVGMTGIRLEVDTKIIYGLSSHMKNITKAVYRAGVDIDDFVLSILAAGEVVADSKQKELGVLIVNIGGPSTTLVVYEEGDIMHTAAIPIGSSHITNDLALGLKTSIDIAEKVKIRYGHCLSKSVGKKETIDLADLGAEHSELVHFHYISEIVEARAAEILEKIDQELIAIDRAGLLPAGVSFVGGGSKIGGLVDLSKEQLSLPARQGQLFGIQGITSKINDAAFAPVIGLVKWGSSVHRAGNKKRFSLKLTHGVRDRFHKIFKSLIP